MPFKPPEQAKCPKCGKAVYAAEEKVAGGHKFHKGCFKCNMCNKFLESTNVSEHNSELYCKQCHGRKFGPKGYGFGGGAGALGMDKGERFGNKACEMDNKPTGDSFTGSSLTGSDSGTGPKCPRCGKTVYDAERAIGSTVPWHKTCFNCKSCKKSVDSSTMAFHEQEVYCKNCYGKNFGPKGFGFGQGAGTLSMG
ncbi:cysteine and glycine-rich protein 2-like isoform X2 [Physella acuta]|uniref:cysteine and glycine-rich protein 2-like isoform X1 n=1 Tax=Physella acuta TaxID=109671 RepID=UPI0027DD3ACF|nr:cysteine and glycine-rich protein 2-like isoform X1 [Physella acuta]XP_059150629.1 cysteine and glycine-rich protein 2-like isoform X2 [Physella acuta]